MDNLQKLLDDKFPEFDFGGTQIAINRRKAERAAFTEGYNAAIKETPRLNADDMWLYFDTVYKKTPSESPTKLELASLMIAQGLMCGKRTSVEIDGEMLEIEKASVKIAKAVLEEANK